MCVKYPVVLVHGVLGFDDILGYPYFFGVKEAMECKGADVFTVSLSALNSDEVRGGQLWDFIKDVKRKTRKDKVNLIGHSQGALDCRYVAAHYPESIASVTSVNGVNHGSEAADALRAALEPGSCAEGAVALAFEAFEKAVAFVSGHPFEPEDAVAALDALTTAGVEAFNAKYPQALPEVWGGEGAEVVNGIYYYSWSGIIKDGLFEQGLNELDPLHMFLKLSAKVFVKEAEENDGLVGRYSSHLGKVIRSDYSMDHLDAINQLAGIRTNTLNTVDLYTEHLERLKDKGL
ncbi:esterase/lipase family protein [Siccibacter turicensis]|uniref:Alpha/beta hydrolase n=1 Tax=Siccibacter turicensis TaxID=357233 RepID=A0A2P8VMJ9_9ENTR|nr:triacylglycerol lipase [Siccibacter turicensis]MDY0969837.1 triacylglycerol lipase [Siccibacter turicensis]PSN08782.1 alpha/beta hydrolase [Siccibacter turicensis]